MDRYKFFSVLVILIVLNSCVTEEPIRGSPITQKDLDTLEIIDMVETTFESTMNTDKKILLRTAYNQLIAIAQKRHDSRIDVMHIELKKNYSKRNLWFVIPTFFTGASVTSFYTSVYAKGVVVKPKENMEK
jgi:hypothetical protein